jgi:hypothetical protein
MGVNCDGCFLKFLREGKIPISGDNVNCQDINLLTAQIYHVVSNKEAVYMFTRLPITGVCLTTKLNASYPWVPIQTIHQIIDFGRLNFSY